ncbi:MAG TPA: Ig-like domain-containing protein [Longimicrobium sp.]|nr:Ig-like domain-containing protein [Longimicrobium sp.]
MRRSLIAAAALLALAACSDSTGSGSPAASLRVHSIVAEGTINAAAGDVVPAVTVRVLDANGNGVSGVRVTWSVAAGTGTLSSAQTVTDATGRASVQWSLGMEMGTQAVEAVAGSVAPVRISTAAAAPSGVLEVVSGSGQIGTVGQPLPQPLVLRYRRADGRPVTGAEVRVVDAAGGTATPGSALTGADGTARFTWTLGGAADRQELTASMITARASAYANGTPAAPRITVLWGPYPSTVYPAPAYLHPGRAYPMGVKVADAYGNVYRDLRVTGVVEAGGGSATSAVTDSAGTAVVSWKIGSVADVIQKLHVEGGGATTPAITSESKWIWLVLIDPPAANSVVAGNFVVNAYADPGVPMNDDPTLPKMFVTVDGRTQQFLHFPARGIFGVFDMSGLAPGPKVATYRAVDPQGHEYVQQIPFTYQP